MDGHRFPAPIAVKLSTHANVEFIRMALRLTRLAGDGMAIALTQVGETPHGCAHSPQRAVKPQSIDENMGPHDRMRGVLSILRAIATHMVSLDRASESAWHLPGRIGAIGRAALAPGSLGVDLELLVRDELLASVADPRRFAVRGPAVRLTSKYARLLGLAVHELATNALKFGALSPAQTQAQLTVSWDFVFLAGSQALQFEWRESGVQMPPDVRISGFGSKLVQRLTGRGLDGGGEMLFSADGVRCRIMIPTREALHPDG